MCKMYKDYWTTTKRTSTEERHQYPLVDELVDEL
jgi:hypothetical protein